MQVSLLKKQRNLICQNYKRLIVYDGKDWHTILAQNRHKGNLHVILQLRE